MKKQLDQSNLFLACQALRRQSDVLGEHLEGACSGEDIEEIHQVRVACRRLRAALRFFEDCFNPGPLRRWRREIKRILKRTGDARDRDIQLAFLHGILEQLPKSDKKIRPGIRRMELRWRQQRELLQPRVVKAVGRLRDRGILVDIHLETEKILFELKDREPMPYSSAVFRRAAEQIRLRLEDLLGRQDCLENPDDIEGHHGMRIAAKRLRYALEICNPAFEDGLKPFIKSFKNLQTLLGDLHDCDVWADRITAFLEEEKERTITYYGHARAFGPLVAGLDYLKEERRKHRSEIFGQVQVLWNQYRQEAFWESLQEAVQKNTEDSDHDGQAP